MTTETNDMTAELDDVAQAPLSVGSLYKLHHRSLLSWLRRRLPVAADADDVAQETWIRLLRYEGSGDILSPKSMLYRVAANVACDQERMGKTRHRWQHSSIEEEEIDFPSKEPSIERVLEGQETYRKVCKNIERLPPRCKQVFLLSRVHGMTYPQIAEHCNISVKMVEKHISHALVELLSHQ